jgi:hypothetical protein
MDQQRFSIPDIDAKINHFQSINAGIVTTIVTTLLSLSIGLIAYATNIVVTSAKPLVGASKCWMIASLVTLLLAALSGIVTLFTRMEDYRRTIDSLAIAKAVERTFVSQENATEALAKISSVADRINLATNIPLYALVILFLAGAGCLAVSVLITNGSKLS